MEGWDENITPLISGLAENGLNEQEWRFTNELMYRRYRRLVQLVIKIKYSRTPLTPEEEEDLVQEVFIANMHAMRTRPGQVLKLGPFSWF